MTVPSRAAASGDVTVAVRPEAISVSPLAGALDAAPNAAAATVEQIIYRGSLTHLYLRLDDGEPLLAFHQNRAGERAPAELAPGGRVVARWTEENNHLVSEA